MAKRRASKRKQSDPAPGWVWMLFGLGLGLAVALAIHFQHRNTSTEPPTAATTAPQPAATPPARPSDSGSGSTASGASGATAAAPQASDENRFLFYEMLPQFEVVVPQPEPGGAASVPPPAAAQRPGSYVLQTGSFSRFEDADRMRATLALRGIESFIQRVEIDEHTFHRVRIGPVDDLDEVDRLQRDLRSVDLEAMLIRVSD